MTRIVTVTTRAPRRGEVPGTSYRFVDDRTFETMKTEGAFLEWATVHGESYGSPRRDVEESLASGKVPLLNVDVQGALSIRRALGGTSVLVFVLPPDEKTLRARLEGRRSDDRSTIERRLQRAREEMALAPEYDYVVVNGDLEPAVARLHAIHEAELSRSGRCLGGEPNDGAGPA